MAELETLVAQVAADDDVSVLMLTGGVPGFFVAHADLEDLASLGRGETPQADPGAWHRTLAQLEDMPQPVVAAVNGQAWGGGCELCLACTLRVAARSAHFGQPEVSVGIIPGAGGTQRLPRVIGPTAAAELVLTGRIVSADEALGMGLVNAVLPDDDFLAHALRWAESLCDKPRAALLAAKRAVVQGLRMPLDEGLRLEGRLFIELQTRADTIGLQKAMIERYASS